MNRLEKGLTEVELTLLFNLQPGEKAEFSDLTFEFMKPNGDVIPPGTVFYGSICAGEGNKGIEKGYALESLNECDLRIFVYCENGSIVAGVLAKSEDEEDPEGIYISTLCSELFSSEKKKATGSGSIPAKLGLILQTILLTYAANTQRHAYLHAGGEAGLVAYYKKIGWKLTSDRTCDNPSVEGDIIKEEFDRIRADDLKNLQAFLNAYNVYGIETRDVGYIMNMCEFHKNINTIQKYCIKEFMKTKTELMKWVQTHGTMCLTSPMLGKDEEKYRIASCVKSCPRKPKSKKKSKKVTPKKATPKKVTPKTPKQKLSKPKSPTLRRSTRKRRAPKRYN